jgi:two-component system nitrogen regulation response regulator GlnG
MSKIILVADDDKAIRMVLSKALAREGYEVRLTGSAAMLWEWVKDGEGHLVISDVVMPDENGLELLPKIKKIRPDLPVIIMSAQNTLMTALKATERGAYEYLPKPFDLNELMIIVKKALAPRNKSANFIQNKDDLEELPLIGRSPAMQATYRTMARLMNSDLTVMITGESGTGKELVARALHDFGKRKNAAFVAINMAAIPKELIESELFGHEKGSFTGADQRGIGHFEQAKGGTLFLDEIGDMPLEAQTRLLRVLQQGEYMPVGANKAVKADVRIIAATHRDLNLLINQGLFREDLYYRLNVVPIALPPLRHRKEDIRDLCHHFMNKTSAENNLIPKLFDKSALKILKNHSWPGNVREVENLISRLTILYTEETITAEIMMRELIIDKPNVFEDTGDNSSLQTSIHSHLKVFFEAHNEELPPNGLYSRILPELEIPLIELCLKATGGNQIKAAELLGLNRNTLRKKIREHNISVFK